ncbi:MAG: hypothetical protein ABI681_03330 [Gemmatimonadales bacterium]
MNTPSEVLNAAFDALNCEDWHAFGELYDPVSLRAFKRQILEDLSEEKHYDISVDDLLESDPDMPREVAEYQVAELNRCTSTESRLERELLTVESLDELREMEPAKVFCQWVKARSPHRRLEKETASGEPWEAAASWDPDLESQSRKATRAYRYRVIGFVPDGPQMAHVLYRSEQTAEKLFPEEYPEWLQRRPEDEQQLARLVDLRADPAIATCRRQSDGSWRLVARNNFMVIGSLQIVELRMRDDE